MDDGPRRRRQAKALKQQLPYPYDQDLSKVLRGLNRRTPFGRRRLANDPVTAAYLMAAVRLIQRHLGPGATRTMADPEDADSISRPLLSFLSQRAIAAEVDHNPPPFHRLGRVSTMRERWRHQSNFIADVLRFGLWAWHYPAAHQDEVADAEQEVICGPDPVQSIHRLCYWYMTRLLATPMFRLGLIAAAQAEGDAVIREAVSQRYRENGPRWEHFYEEFLRSRGLRIRSGLTLDDCANLLAAVADGLAIRALTDPAARIIDDGRRHSLLGTAALALIAGCLERTDQGKGVPLEQAVRDMVCEPATSQDRQPE
jgi:hypothetical protein